MKSSLFTPSSEVPAAITQMATRLVLDILPGRCPEWRQWQLFRDATTLVGFTNHPPILRELKRSIRYRGMHEYEVEAVEEVLLKWHRRFYAH